MTETTPAKPPEGGAAKLLIDLGPLLLFLGSYWVTGMIVPVALVQIVVSTIVFMFATVVAMLFSQFRFGRISPLLWFSGIMVLVFGTLTVWLKNPAFIQMKPTIYYSVVATILFFGVVTGRPTLKAVLEHAYSGLRENGWQLLTRNFAWFFVAMAVLNEIVWRNTSMDFWLGYKLWGALPLTLLFGVANVPMILRHSDEEEKVA